jgi:hypothetical protein
MPFTYGAFTPQDGAYVQQLINESAASSTGSVFYLDPANGNDTNTGLSPTSAFQSLAQAYAALTSGKNDTIFLIGDGSTAATARVNAAFTWAKSATRLIGVSSGVNISNRSRIAPTGTTTAFANFFTVSGSGCLFANIQWFHGFDTGTTAAICMTVTGGRNLFLNCHIAGMGDAASAQSATSRNLKISGTGENEFVDCTIGIDTVTRTVANASVEFASACPRNQFHNCLFPIYTSSATTLGIIVAAAAGSDRFQLFKSCIWMNAVGSGSTTMTGLATLAASIGGILILKDCTCVGFTDLFTDTTTRDQLRIDGAAPTSTTTGLAITPA